MKNKFLIFAPLILPILTSCVQFSTDSLSEGLVGGESSSDVSQNIEFVENADLSSLVPSFSLTFKSSQNEGGYISTFEEFLNLLEQDSGYAMVNGIDTTTIKYVAQGYQGMKLGINVGSNQGFLSAYFNSSFVAVSIVATPRYVELYDSSSHELTLNIDTNSSISVDGTHFIHLASSFETYEDVKPTTCNFLLDESTNNLELFSYSGRVNIQTITFYSSSVNE